MHFRRKKVEYNNKVPIYTCDRHKFSTSDPIEIEEHERTHALSAGDGTTTMRARIP
jgi:hypothetical protein